MQESDEVFVGIDVSKAHLDVAIHGSSEVCRVSNDEKGIEGLVSKLLEVRPTLVVLEATGGFGLMASAVPTARALRIKPVEAMRDG